MIAVVAYGGGGAVILEYMAVAELCFKVLEAVPVAYHQVWPPRSWCEMMGW